MNESTTRVRAHGRLQYVAHDGRKARERRLKQQQAREAKARKKRYGIEVDAKGRTPVVPS